MFFYFGIVAPPAGFVTGLQVSTIHTGAPS
jgi:hypothetical protein